MERHGKSQKEKGGGRVGRKGWKKREGMAFNFLLYIGVPPVIAVRKGYIEIQRDKKWMCMERI